MGREVAAKCRKGEIYTRRRALAVRHHPKLRESQKMLALPELLGTLHALRFPHPKGPLRLAVRTRPFHGCNTGSIPVEVANFLIIRELRAIPASFTSRVATENGNSFSRDS